MLRLPNWRVLIIGIALLNGCEYVRPTINAPLEQWQPAGGYRLSNLAPPTGDNSDSLLILASFSGGGTRASALAFGALRHLANRPIIWEGQQKRLLDEVDAITALSGGAFTAAYYALYGDRIFQDFETRFLRRDWDREIRSRILLSPSNWFRLWSPYFGRTHILAEMLDEAIFDGKTYGDLLRRQRRPFLNIHASDMAILSRFEFTQEQFDWICSDMSQLLLARASAASAALPLALSPISFKNYAGACDFKQPSGTEDVIRSGGAAGQRMREIVSYLDAKKRPYIHLLDGGLSDNMGLRGLLEGGSVLGGLENLLKFERVKNVKKFVIISVNAETAPDVMDFGDEIPTIFKALNALIDVPINRYSSDTISLLRLGIELSRQQLRTQPRAADSPFADDADIYFINASLAEIQDPDERAALMKIPTGLYLTDEQIERLLRAAVQLIQHDPEFQRLMRDIN